MDSDQALVELRFETKNGTPGSALLFSNTPKNLISAEGLYKLVDKKLFGNGQEKVDYILFAANLKLPSKIKYLVELDRNAEKILPINWNGQSRVKLVLHGIRLSDHLYYSSSSEDDENSPDKTEKIELKIKDLKNEIRN